MLQKTPLLTAVVLLSCLPLFGQYFSNPSFEGNPAVSVSPPGWYACNDQSTPDTHPAKGAWNFTFPASEGSTYIGLVMRGYNDSSNDYLTEAAGTQLLQPLKKGTCYFITIDLAFNPLATFYTGWEVLAYDTPGHLLVWGATTNCGKEKLLWKSPLVSNSQWQSHSFKINPETDFTYLILEADYANSSNKRYGNLLIDNLRINTNQIELGPDKIICENGEITLGQPEPTGVFLWSTGENTSQITVSKEGTYWLEVIRNGCFMKDAINVVKISPFKTDLGSDLSLCNGDVHSLDAMTPNGNYIWSTGSTDPKITVTQSGTYHVTVDNGCEIHMDDITITYRENCCDLKVPNVFTPNADSFNDHFEVASESTLLSYKLKVYNRWGQVMFVSDDLSKSWDGTSNSSEVSSGTYYWVSAITCLHKQETTERTIHGSLNLVR